MPALKIPSELVILGRVRDFVWNDEEDKIAKYNGRLILCASQDGNVIYGLPWSDHSYRMPLDTSKTKFSKLYRTWSDFDPDAAFSLSVNQSDITLFRCGKADRLIYSSKKWTGRDTLYEHTWKSAYAYRSKSGKTVAIARTDGNRIVRSVGLVG